MMMDFFRFWWIANWNLTFLIVASRNYKLHAMLILLLNLPSIIEECKCKLIGGLIANWLFDWLVDDIKLIYCLNNLRHQIDLLFDWLMTKNRCSHFADDCFQIFFFQWLMTAKGGASHGWIGPNNFLWKKTKRDYYSENGWTFLEKATRLLFREWLKFLRKSQPDYFSEDGWSF